MVDFPSDVTGLLGPKESVEFYIQQKVYHPTLNIDSIVLTNQRIILRHPHDLGLKKDFTDFPYSDVANVTLQKGILRSTVSCNLRFKEEPLNLTDLPNTEAEAAYGIIRQNILQQQTSLASGYGSLSTGGTVTRQQLVIVTEQEKVCSVCGEKNRPGSRYCGACGSPL